ncbi:hypothetical protein C8A05DRAFT_47019 [Staphylotrichum tortipilum]|uniref:Uncharacterized protein n=1 Tax=Staphylotrichum tortipilum TaxID=2831512 RepID=A0AAN6MDD9_9PEZI|nr:hypothetical protein C8A05DRAFT_47019 [Staphylotrichum longicolle]
MPQKTREYYLTTSYTRDFAWFFFGKPTSTAKQPPRQRVESTPPYRISKVSNISKPRPGRLPPTKKHEARHALMAPGDVKAMALAVKARSKPAKPKKPESKPKPKPKHKKTGPDSVGPWSDWYVSGDRNYFWRARQSQNDKWDYQFTPSYQETTSQTQETTEDTAPTTSSSSLNRPLSSFPEDPPEDLPASPDPNQSPTPNPASPKSSWPTIITTSTGQPTADLSASSNRTLTSLAKELCDGDDDNDADHPWDSIAYTTTPRGLADAIPFPTTTPAPATAPTTNPKPKKKKPISPVMRLLQESVAARSSRKTKTDAAPPQLHSHQQQHQPQDQHQQDPTATQHSQGNDKAMSALARKLHARVKAEKELKVDPKRRVKAWLKGVEVPMVGAGTAGYWEGEQGGEGWAGW